MTEITLILGISTAILFVALTVMTWYAITLLKKLWRLSSNIDEAQFVIENFKGHIEAVYNLETFYGDPTLQQLLQHAESVSETLDSYEDMYSFIEMPDDDEIVQEGEEDGT